MSYVLKYAPKVLADVVIANTNVKDKLAAYVAGELKQPLILHGEFGTGKTTIANLLPSAIEGKPALIEKLKAVEFNTVYDVSALFNAPPMFYKLFTTNGQNRNYMVSNEFNFTVKAALAFRDVIDELQEHTQFIFTTNNLASIDKGLQDRSICLNIPPVSARDWLPRAKFILKEEGVKLKDAQLLNFLTKQLAVSTSNRKLLEQLEALVWDVKNPKTLVVTKSIKDLVPPKTPKPKAPVVNPLLAI